MKGALYWNKISFLYLSLYHVVDVFVELVGRVFLRERVEVLFLALKGRDMGYVSTEERVVALQTGGGAFGGDVGHSAFSSSKDAKDIN